MTVMDEIIQEELTDESQRILSEINAKFEAVHRRIEELKFEKILGEAGGKDIGKIEQYEQYELQSPQASKKSKERPSEKSIRLEPIRSHSRTDMLKN
jgi:hypothetical protein